MKQRAWLTLLTNEAYLPGVQGLARSLRRVGSRYPLVAMFTDGVGLNSRRMLEAEGIGLRHVPRFDPARANAGVYLQPNFTEVWTKLRCWEQEEFSRVGYLDADLLLLQNIDEILDMPGEFLAAPDCFGDCEKSLGQDERGACPLFRPEEAAYFNSGLLVLTPTRGQLEGFLNQMQGMDPSRWKCADQDFLNQVYAGRWVHLSYTYNTLKYLRFNHPHLWDPSAIKSIHFVCSKPWQVGHPENEPFQDLNALWWRIYNGD